MSKEVAKSNNLPSEGFALLDLNLLDPNEGQLEGLPANPREIHAHKYELLKKNIVEHPEFLKYNLLKVFPLSNGRYIVIGGNMRCRALQELKIFKKVPCAIIDSNTSIEDLKAYVILDNAGFGRWEWQMIANEWDEAQITSWGVDLPTMEAPGSWGAMDEITDELEDPNLTKNPRFAIILPVGKEDIKDALIADIKQLIADTPDYEGCVVKTGRNA